MRKFLRKYRRIFYLFGTIIIIIVAISARSMYRNSIVEQINVIVVNSANLKFITKNSLIEYLASKYEEQIIGEKFKDIKVSAIKEILAKNPYIESLDIYRNDNILNIQLKQKKPVVRVIDKKNSEYYIDNKGNFFPLNPDFSAYTIIANGNISHLMKNDSLFKMNINDTIFKNSNIPELYLLVNKINSNDFVNKLIDEIYVNNDGEFILVPRVGRYKINIGNTQELNKKFQNLEVFYKEVLPTAGWSKFSEINLKHTNQIICKKVRQ